MIERRIGKRVKHKITPTTLHADMDAARRLFSNGAALEAFDTYEQLAVAYPAAAIAILAELYDCYQLLPGRDRYSLYQSRHFDFGIGKGDKVLDIGSGHLPFPLATHLADIAVTDHAYGRAGVPFRHIDGKPVYECSVENTPFADKEFDFVYCSHVLEHTKDPERACRELMRIGKRGYIETPTKGKDIFLNSAKISNHTQHVELCGDCLVFTDYTPEEQAGLECDVLLQMNCRPQNEREKAFAALMLLKSDLINTMLLWEGSFRFTVRSGKAAGPTGQVDSKKHGDVAGGKDAAARQAPLKFMQVHLFYPHYLNELYNRSPELSHASFDDQINAIVRDGFGAIHMFAPYMTDLGYESHLVIANNQYSQHMWMRENGSAVSKPDDWIKEIARKQIEAIKPDILYLTDPVGLDSSFVRSLSWKPALILGWKASDIPEGTDWSEFDVLMSNLSAMRTMALQLGAKAAEHFSPGFPAWINRLTEDVVPRHDVVFSGSWTWTQHEQRNRYLHGVAQASLSPAAPFSCGYYICGDPSTMSPEVNRLNLGGRFGVAMHRALKNGRIVLDARGSLEFKNAAGVAKADLAVKETSNMRVFEATGSGVFLLTEHFDNLSGYFEPGVEIETFRDEKELLDKIGYYLAHPDKREEIALRGQARCLRDYSIEKRAAELDQIIKKHLASPDSCSDGIARVMPATTHDEPVSSWLSGSEEELNRLASLATPLYASSEAGDFARKIMLSPNGARIRSLLKNCRPVCKLFPEGIFILSDGSVTTCCNDAMGANRFDSIYENPMHDIWNRHIPRIVQGDLYDMPACRGCIGSHAASITSGEEELHNWHAWPAKYPTYIQIEIMGTCNYGCCISRDLHRHREVKPDLDKIFDNIRDFLPHIKQLNLFNYGEPLLNDGFLAFLHKCRSAAPTLILNLATNGMLLDEKHAERFIDDSLDYAIVSVHGGPGTEGMLKYSGYGADYDKVIANVKRLLEKRRLSGKSHPKIQLKAILFNWNDSDAAMDRFRADARDLGLTATTSRDADKYYWVLDADRSGTQRFSQRFYPGSPELQRLIDAQEFE